MNSFKHTVRRACVYYNNVLAGYLLRNKRRYVFLYCADYVNSKNPSIALDMPKKKRLFSSPYLFPYFQGLLPEGANKSFYCERLGVDRTDKFTMLVKFAAHETIGAVTLREED